MLAAGRRQPRRPSPRTAPSRKRDAPPSPRRKRGTGPPRKHSRTTATARQEAREELIRLDGGIEAIAAREAELVATLAREEHELAAAELSLASLADGTAGDAVEPAIAAAAAAEQAWRSAVAELAAADDELLAAEQAVSELRARHSDLIASQARLTEEAARHEARLEHTVNEREAAEAELGELRAVATAAAESHDTASRDASAALATLEVAGSARDTAQEAADATRRIVIELTEHLQATRAELAALAEPHDAGSRLGRRLSAAGWPTLLDALSAPEASWPAIEAVVGGELESALLWADEDPTGEIGDARGAARLLAPDAGAHDDGRTQALAAVAGERTLAEWIAMPAAPRVFARTVLAPDLDALLAGWRRLPPGWAAVTATGDLADARGVVIRGRGDPPGGAAARAHARRRELGQAVTDIEARFAEGQHAAHTAAEALRASRAEHLAAREAHDELERAARVARESRVAADAAVARGKERLEALESDLVTLRAGSPAAASAGDGDVEPNALSARQAAADQARSRRDALAARRDESRDAWTSTRRAAEEDRDANRRDAQRPGGE